MLRRKFGSWSHCALKNVEILHEPFKRAVQGVLPNGKNGEERDESYKRGAEIREKHTIRRLLRPGKAALRLLGNTP